MSTYVGPETFLELGNLPEPTEGVDWRAAVPDAEWQEHEARLESVIEALAFAEAQP
jgi:hypothetical protein